MRCDVPVLARYILAGPSGSSDGGRVVMTRHQPSAESAGKVLAIQRTPVRGCLPYSGAWVPCRQFAEQQGIHNIHRNTNRLRQQRGLPQEID